MHRIPARVVLTLQLLSLALLAPAAYAGDQGDPTQSCDGSTADMVECLKGQTAVEINASPSRLDLNDVFARRAREHGLKLSIGSDAHRPVELNQVEFGVYVAQRAWLNPEDILNCWDIERLLAWTKEA